MKAIDEFVFTKPNRLNKIVTMDLLNFIYFLRNNNYIEQEQIDKMWGKLE